MEKVANQLFLQKKQQLTILPWGHVLKTCFFISHLKQQKFLLLLVQVWVLWEKKVAKTIAFVILWFLSKKTKHLKVKVFFKFQGPRRQLFLLCFSSLKINTTRQSQRQPIKKVNDDSHISIVFLQAWWSKHCFSVWVDWV